MSTIFLDSACGRTTKKIDLFDLGLNPHGVVCCEQCESIIESRNNWKERINNV